MSSAYSVRSKSEACSRLKAARLEYLKAKIVCQLLDQIGPIGDGQVLRALQVARAAQRLRLPSSEHIPLGGLLQPNLLSAHASPPIVELDTAVAGSSAHCLGVPPPALGGMQIPSSEVDAVMGRLSSQLCEWMEKWAGTLLLKAGAPPSSSSKLSRDAVSTSGANPQSPSTNSVSTSSSGELSVRLVAQASGRRAALATKQQAMHRQLTRLLHSAVRLLRLYDDMGRAMLQFVEQEVMQRQAQLDQKSLAYDVSWVELMESKLRSIEVQLESQTYLRTHVAALQRVDGLIREMAGNVQRTLEQVSSHLSTYQALGPSFASLASEYGLVRRQVAEAQRMLASFDAFEAELAQEGHQRDF